MIEMPNIPGNQKPEEDKKEPKHHTLKKMQELGVSNNDAWYWDGLSNVVRYEDTFHDLLGKLDYTSFEDLVEQREYERKRELNVLDLFGGAYFLRDLSSVNSITGARLANVDEEMLEDPGLGNIVLGKPGDYQILKRIIQSPKREIVEGDLYKTETWKKLQEAADQKTENGFDLIVCRPEGPFAVRSRPVNSRSIADVEDESQNREEIYVMLLEKAMNMLSPDHGLLFSQIPGLNTPSDIKKEFWNSYIKKKEAEGYVFHFDSEADYPFETFAVERNQSK